MNAGNMYGAMVPIASFTLIADAAVFTFSNIPQTFQDLMLVAYWRDTTASTGNSSIYLTTNHYNGSSNLYSQTLLSGDGSSASSTRATAKTYADTLGFVPKNSNATGIFGSAIFHFLNYANTTTNKTYLVRTSADLNGSGNTSLAVGLIAGTAAINTVAISPLTQILAGSTATLYGIRAVSS
jgi:hypothetical protein